MDYGIKDKREESPDRLFYWIDEAPGEFRINDIGDKYYWFWYTRQCETLVKQGYLERVGKKRGWYRKVEPECEQFDFVNANDEPADLWLPLRLSEYVQIHYGNLIVIAGAPNSGKALRNGTPILTKDGWKPIERLRRGSKVFGKNGGLTKVLGVYPQGFNPCYRFIFNDGSSIDSDKNHLWTIQTSYQLHKRKTGHGEENKQFGKWVTMTTEQIVAKYGLGKITQKTPKFPSASPINFKRKKTKIHPYVMGLLLGDGCFVNSTTKISTIDNETLNTLAVAGYKINHDQGCDYRILNIYKEIDFYGLKGKRSHEKFIPNDYLFNDVESRLSLIKGLMDTDGSIDKKGFSIEYCSVSKRLAEDVQFLVRSLGGRASIKESESYFNYKGIKKQGKNRFRVSIKIGIKIFNLKRKRERQRVLKKTDEKKLHEIIWIGRQETTCIKVSVKDGLFVAKDFIVTHNTAFMLNIVKENMLKDWDVGYFTSEMESGELKLRLKKFPDISLDQWRFKAYRRGGDFQDVIKPGKNSLNIVDFLEVHDEFYIIARRLKEIHDKLNGGIAVVGLQKNPGQDTGLGGWRSMEVTRLAIALDWGRCKIVKAKNWVDPEMNPNNWVISFKLVDGCRIIPGREGWQRETKKGDK